jgi:hypothetical protein
MPAYVDAHQFAITLLDITDLASTDFSQLGEDIKKNISDPQLRRMLLSMYSRVTSMEAFRKQLANWFDASMQRVSGDYKRYSQLFCFLIALAIAAAFNVDSFKLFSTLWTHPAYAAQLSATGLQAADAASAAAQLQKLPIGWTTFPPTMTGPDIGLMIAGWFVTACSVLFGAPFWFDLLQRFVQVRGTGAKPKTKEKDGA